MQTLKHFWQEWGKALLLALLVGFLIRAEVAEALVVPTASMVPSVMPGDRLLAEKIAYRFTGPRHGDIIVFKPPVAAEPDAIARMAAVPDGPLRSTLGLEDDYLKRVIGLPGDTVEVRAGLVYLNGKLLLEPYIMSAGNYSLGPIKVPDGKLFVLGDNRNNSNDSHVWGFVDETAVRGRALVRFWPPARFGKL